MIRVRVEPENKLVHATMGGMLDRSEVIRFGRDEQAAARSLGVESGEFVLLIETIGNQIQTQEVMETFRELITNSPLKAKRIATVRDGVLTRMQTKRISRSRDNAEVFDNVAEARAWLLEDMRADDA